ncbi:MAG: FKBP-type peptidyl-prolyl cis-trans isomerase [Bacteroidales bacterium]|nr:FKBP-type peptidyl-prolyl cis-trans isomerase [Bacteroidales bacterium]
MNIQKNAFVVLTYELRTEGSANGPLVEKVTSDRPLRFVFGMRMMLPLFENHIAGLTSGDKFEFTIVAKDAYGEYDKDSVVDIPKSVFIVDGQLREDLLKVGGRVPMMNDQGQRIDGIVSEVTDEVVKMDFNHPLAGEDLYFAGEIIEVREATEEELHPQHRCGGGCGSCGGGCGSGENHGDCGCGGGCGEDGCCH